jgi:tetratricopeptide (TPR) repeat protein
MTDFLRKFFGNQQNSQSADEDTDLEKFYTDSEYALQIFEQLVNAPYLPKRLLVIHGIGGVGKSTLLKMYRFSCRRQRIPSAMVASEEAPSPVDVLAGWAQHLNLDGVTLPVFQKTMTHYRAIQAKVETEVEKASQATSQLAGTIGKTAAKTAIGMAASFIPIFGPLVSAVGGESADAFADWLRGFLSKPDVELYLDPATRLDNDFLSDLANVTTRQRIVLMIDTYEQMTALDHWMRELARSLPKNVLLIIASRTVPSWDRSWQDWMGKAEIVEVKEMTPNDLRTLVHRYYAYIRSGDPDPKQVEAIVEFARGLPMVATTVVQLWVKYGVEDFQTVRPQVVADLVDRLLEGVPQAMRPAFETAAVLRFFNVDALGAMLDEGNAEELYAELWRWPFIRPRREGLAVHATMRAMMNEALHVRAPGRFRTLHERAEAYYEARLEKSTGDERERYTLEILYHSINADEESGSLRFQELAEELTAYRLANRLRVVLNDVNTYPFATENSRLWKEYYSARLVHLEAQFVEAEEVYQAIAENDRVEPKLRAYVLCDWGSILCRRERLRQPGGEEKAVRVLESSLNLRVATDAKMAMSWVYLSDIYIAKCDMEKALSYLEEPRTYFSKRNDYSGLLAVLDYERSIYARLGNLRKTFDVEEAMWKIYMSAGEPSYLRTRVSPTWERLWAGFYAEHEKELRTALNITRSLRDQEYLCVKTRDLACGLGLQGKCAEAWVSVEESLSLAYSLGSAGEQEVFGALTIYGIVCYKCGQLDRAEQYFMQSITIGQKLRAHNDTALLPLATVYEVLKDYEKAQHFYQLAKTEAHPLSRHYYEGGALTGLVRVKRVLSDYPAISSLWSEAKQLAQQYEYNDYFTSLYLTRGHLIWDGFLPEWESGFDLAFHYYQLALIHALRFNRFLLDEALSGGGQCTPLHPIIQNCLEHREEGQRMLLALRNWWQNGINDTGVPRLDTISPLPEGILLSEAERMARNRETGDGAQQRDVVEQINAALARVDRV